MNGTRYWPRSTVQPPRGSAYSSYRPALEPLEARLAPANLPPGFSETLIAPNLARPTAFELAPDGRMFILEQGGRVRVVSDSQLLPTPFVTLNVDERGERGLLGIAFDPQFATNQFVYLYYTTSTAPIHNRVSRFVANGNVAVPGSETVLLDLENLSATNHNGGAIHFGADGKLYVGVGENAVGANAQSLSNRLGKILRINADGTIPSDNPFFTTASGANRAIWALGLRNPFTFAVQPGTGRIFINDVGAQSFEEINDGVAGGNYGWPTTEGEANDIRFRDPLFAYPHGAGNQSGIAIAGGVFYNPARVQFPPEFVGDYFFADLGNGWIRRYDPATDSVMGFATGLPSGTVDLKVDADGSLLYLNRGTGQTTGQLVRVATPITAEQRLIRNFFLDLLGRSATAGDEQFWLGRLPAVGRSGVAGEMLRTPEAARRLVQGYYNHFLNRGLDSGAGIWIDQLQLLLNAEDVIASILNSPEFAARANTLIGTPDPDANFIGALYRLVLSRTGSTAEINFWQQQLPQAGRLEVARAFLFSHEFRGNYVRMYYGQPTTQPLAFVPNLLRRQTPPAEAEVDFWVRTSLNMLLMETAIAGSREYFLRV
jgi:glucose/arabinose dehydrogenase